MKDFIQFSDSRPYLNKKWVEANAMADSEEAEKAANRSK